MTVRNGAVIGLLAFLAIGRLQPATGAPCESGGWAAAFASRAGPSLAESLA
jgi:hypothetical protein